MANYAYIRVTIAGSKESRIEAFERVLRLCVLKTLDERWSVELMNYEDGGPVWDVFLPDTVDPVGATGRLVEEPVGFAVAMQPRAIAFRHSINNFAHWAQGRVEEEIADYFGKGVYFDATDRTKRPGTRDYRVGKTFKEYVMRNGSDVTEAYLQSRMESTPEGHWE